MKPCTCCDVSDCGFVLFVSESKYAELTKCGVPGFVDATKRYKTHIEVFSLSASDSNSGGGFCISATYSWTQTLTVSDGYTATLQVVIGADGRVDKVARSVSGSGTSTNVTSYTGPPECDNSSSFSHGHDYALDPADDAESPGPSCDNSLPGVDDVPPYGPNGSWDIGAPPNLPGGSYQNVSQTHREQSKTSNTGWDSWNALVNYDLSNEYTTDELLTNLGLALDADPWVSGGGTAYLLLSSNELTATGKRLRYRFKVKIGYTCRVRVTWDEVFYPAGGGDPVTLASREATWETSGTREEPCHEARDGYDPTDYETYPEIEGPDDGWWLLEVPDEPGVIQIENVVEECEYE